MQLTPHTLLLSNRLFFCFRVWWCHFVAVECRKTFSFRNRPNWAVVILLLVLWLNIMRFRWGFQKVVSISGCIGLLQLSSLQEAVELIVAALASSLHITASCMALYELSAVLNAPNSHCSPEISLSPSGDTFAPLKQCSFPLWTFSVAPVKSLTFGFTPG